MMNYNHIPGKKLEIKSAQNLKVEGRLLCQLDYLKKSGGPFTSCEEIENFLERENVSEKDKKKRMKTEIQYARDSSISLPRSNPVFKIRKRVAKGGKLKDLSSSEFGDNLKTLISKKISSLNKKVSIASFVSALDSININV